MIPPDITVDVARLSVEIAELRISAVFMGDPGESTELRGRLMGPRSPIASTIEIAYPLKAIADPMPNVRATRVLIPEPNLWSEAKPLTYWGPVEVWVDDTIVYSKHIEIGLRSIGRQKPLQ